MFILDYIYNVLVVMWSKYDALPLVAFMIAFFVNVLATTNNKTFKWVESLLVGTLATIVWLASSYLGIPEELRAGACALVGYHGSKATINFFTFKLLGKSSDDINKS